jgi:hypothetical protein
LFDVLASFAVCWEVLNHKVSTLMDHKKAFD